MVVQEFPELKEKLSGLTSEEAEIDLLNEYAYNLWLSLPVKTGEIALLAKEKAEKIQYKPGQAAAYRNLGISLTIQGKLQQALSNFEQALQLYQELNDQEGISIIKGSIGNVYVRLNQYGKALEWQQESLRIARKLNMKSWVAVMLGNIGNVYIAINRYEAALEYHREALRIHEELNHWSGKILSFTSIGSIYELSGEYEKALEQLEFAIQFAQQSNDKNLVVYPLYHKGVVLRKMQRLSEATKILFHVLEISREIGHASTTCLTLNQLAMIHAEIESWQEALEFAEQALLESQKISSISNEADALQTLTYCHEQLGNYEKAYRYQQDYLEAKEKVIDSTNKQLLDTRQAQHEIEAAAQEKEIFRLKNIELAKANEEIAQKNESLSALAKSLEENFRIIDQQSQAILSNLTYACRIQATIFPSQDEIKQDFTQAFYYRHCTEPVFGICCWAGKKETTRIVTTIGFGKSGVSSALLSILSYYFCKDLFQVKGITDITNLVNRFQERIKPLLVESTNNINLGIIQLNEKNNQVQAIALNVPVWVVQNQTTTFSLHGTWTFSDSTELGILFAPGLVLPNQYEIVSQKIDTIFSAHSPEKILESVKIPNNTEYLLLGARFSW
ncbi:MAG: tetratricopeptide repeat protein [Bacteroidia bacterium]|nr:tetratricopeptide repeat protein [Bacteroidia bacterium]